MFNWTSLMPSYVRHSFYEYFVLISYDSCKYILKYTDIILVKKESTFITEAIIYIHNIENILNKYVIWIKSANRIISLLRSKNINIEE